jgi:rhamnopyranosyl-N-acetylglucosaminyl-diphospho-decaprenol beta-1,3/1,4-galactofuranosyltransferase
MNQPLLRPLEVPQPNQMPTIAAVIVTSNRKLVLAECIRSILDGERVPGQIIVVDNASSDGTPGFVKENFPGVASVLRLPRNKGGAGGFKAGIEEALRLGYDLLWLMEDDHMVERDTLQVLAAALKGPAYSSPRP